MIGVHGEVYGAYGTSSNASVSTGRTGSGLPLLITTFKRLWYAYAEVIGKKKKLVIKFPVYES